VLVSAGTDYTRAGRLATALEQAQQSLLATAVRRALFAGGDAPDVEALDTVVTELGDQGLRYVGVESGGAIIAEAGVRTLPLAGGPGAPGTVEGAGVIQARRMGSGLRSARGRGSRRAGLVFEYEPALSNTLQAGARRSLGLGIAVAGALAIGGAALTRQARQAAALAAGLARERHLAALGEMSALLAHELRNPLASLKGNAQLLLETLPEGRDLDRGRWVVREAERMEALTNDLLDFARSGIVQRVPVDPAAALRDAARELHPSVVRVSTEGAPPSWSLDPLRVHQALTNLLHNAVQAKADPPPEARVEERDGALVFEVRDHGAGLPDVPQERLFEPFHTTRTQGTGLGLAVVQRVARLHGGEATAGPAPGGGALFTLTIPREGRA
jgi:two-component system sensor histidine kinase HydH